MFPLKYTASWLGGLSMKYDDKYMQPQWAGSILGPKDMSSEHYPLNQDGPPAHFILIANRQLILKVDIF